MMRKYEERRTDWDMLHKTFCLRTGAALMPTQDFLHFRSFSEDKSVVHWTFYGMDGAQVNHNNQRSRLGE